MKKITLLIFCTLFLHACADEKTNNNPTPATASTQPQAKTTQAIADSAAKPKSTSWNGSILSDATIKQVQEDKYIYTQCVYKEAQKKGYKKIESRVATDAVIKQCEPELSKIRETFVNDGVPEVIADRYLKKTRIDITRRILKSLMFAEAARKSGAIQ
ncbi:hypothetical protein [Methyloprofundus sp.]|uniref:hypothetical protein n=1 Tax=Methyloprofundus sp. TaxID=2020875 RepID=UPI003D10227C